MLKVTFTVGQWCRIGVLLIRIITGHGSTVLAIGAGGGCSDIFFLAYHFFFLSSFLWKTTRYRLKYCVKEQLYLKQPTNQFCAHLYFQIKDQTNLNPYSAKKTADNKFYVCYNSKHVMSKLHSIENSKKIECKMCRSKILIYTICR